MLKFRNRTDAGQRLAAELDQYANQPNALVLALPRGGVPVAFEIAQALNLPLDIYLVRKLGVPEQPELAMGAIAPGNIMVLNTMCCAALASRAKLYCRWLPRKNKS
jgi:putative phosphoribosyl transferase